MSVQAVYAHLRRLKPVYDNDITGLVKLINEVELCHSQLGEVRQLESITMLQIDELTNLFPLAMQKDWYNVYNKLSEYDQIHPFASFMEFLESERDVVIRMAEKQPRKAEPQRQMTSTRSLHFETNHTKAPHS